LGPPGLPAVPSNGGEVGRRVGWGGGWHARVEMSIESTAFLKKRLANMNSREKKDAKEVVD